MEVRTIGIQSNFKKMTPQSVSSNLSVLRQSNLSGVINDEFLYNIGFAGNGYQVEPPKKNNSLHYLLFLKPQTSEMSAQKAWEIYSNFKDGNYFAPEIGTFIREINFSFLDCIKSTAEKEKFVKLYENLTGFPSLYNVSQKLKGELIRATKATSQSLKNNPEFKKHPEFFDVLAVGYDGVSSAGKHVALPGSDLNNAYVIIRGSENMSEWNSLNLAGRFLQELRKNTDHRILSYARHPYSAPQVYTQPVVESWLGYCDNATERVMRPGLLTVLFPILNSLKNPRSQDKNERDEAALHTYYTLDPISRNEFFKDMCAVSELPDDVMFPFCLFLEALKKGEPLIPYTRPQTLKNSVVPHYLNLSQITVQKECSDIFKDTHCARQDLAKKYKRMNVDEKFDIVKTMIKASALKPQKYEQYFNSSYDNIFDSIKYMYNLDKNS